MARVGEGFRGSVRVFEGFRGSVRVFEDNENFEDPPSGAQHPKNLSTSPTSQEAWLQRKEQSRGLRNAAGSSLWSSEDRHD